MPFAKGRQKTGGRQKGGGTRKATKFVDQLKNAGFNYVKEFADTLKDIKDLRHLFSGDPKKAVEDLKKAEEVRHYYSELRFLLPYMAPKLREKEVEVIDEPEDSAQPQAPVTDEELLKALGDDTKTDTQPRASRKNGVGTRDSELQVPASTAENLSSLAGEQEEDA